jgi:predicted transcriptional regulator YdeE
VGSFAPDRFETGEPMLLGGLRRRYEFAAGAFDFAGQWREFLSHGKLAGRVGSNFYGVMCGANATGFEYMCAAQVESFAGLPEGMGRMRVPAQRYAVFEHAGPASALRSTWQQIFDWLASGPYESAHQPDFEVYGPDFDLLAGGDGAIEVWVGVVPRVGAGTRAGP